MATSIFTLLDDVALLADDIAVAAKVGTQKAAGILSDDIAVGAKKATGFHQSRELQVIYRIAMGSFLNKFIIIPIVFLLNYIYPPLIIYTLILGGFYLAFEGAESFNHWFKKKEHHDDNHEKENISEDEKVKGAIKTDFILSLEIVIIALNAIENKEFFVQLSGVFFVAMLATVGVYGLVAAIVRLDDIGFWFKNRNYHKIGDIFISSLSYVIKSLSFIGVIAMLMVAGGIFVHHIHLLHNDFEILKRLSLLNVAYDIFIGLITGQLIILSKVFVETIFGKFIKIPKE